MSLSKIWSHGKIKGSYFVEMEKGYGRGEKGEESATKSFGQDNPRWHDARPEAPSTVFFQVPELLGKVAYSDNYLLLWTPEVDGNEEYNLPIFLS